MEPMLKLKMKPSEYITIGEDIKVAYVGGNSNNITILVDAPMEYRVNRNGQARKGQASPYYKEFDISKDAHDEIAKILKREKYKNHIGNHS